MGYTEDAIEEALSEESDDVDAIEIWPENWAVLLMFFGVQTQWRTGALGGYNGLDYHGVRGRFPDITDQQFDDLQAMERAALPILNAKS